MFNIQGPIDPESPLFVGREDALRQISGWLTHVSCVGIVLGARQTGKTSLLLRLRHTLRSKYAFVFVDLQIIEGASIEECYQYIASEIIDQLNQQHSFADQTLPTSSISFSTFLRWCAIQVSAVRIIILIDEIGALPIETATRLAHTVRSVFSSRLVKQEFRRYVFILSGAVDMLRLSTGRSSPLWNVTESLYVTDLTKSETRQLLHIGLANTDAALIESINEQIYIWTSGHPYWTQFFADKLATDLHDLPTDQIKELVNEVLRTEDRNLPHLFRLLSQRRETLWPILENVLDGGHVPFTRTDPNIAELELCGAITNADGMCAIRNAIYRELLYRQISANSKVQHRKREEMVEIDPEPHEALVAADLIVPRNEINQASKIIKGTYEFQGTPQERAEFINNAGLYSFVGRLALSGPAEVVARNLLNRLNRHGFLVERPAYHALGQLFAYLIEMNDMGLEDRKYIAGLIVRYGLVRDPLYIEGLRASYKLTATHTAIDIPNAPSGPSSSNKEFPEK